MFRINLMDPNRSRSELRSEGIFSDNVSARLNSFFRLDEYWRLDVSDRLERRHKNHSMQQMKTASESAMVITKITSSLVSSALLSLRVLTVAVALR